MKMRINLSGLDMFGKEVALNYKENTAIRTSFGGIFSLACIVAIVLFFRDKAFSFVNKDEITVNSIRQFSNIPSLLSFPTDNFMVAVKIQQTDFLKTPYYNISVSQRKYLLYSNGTRVTTITPIKLEPCTLDHWSFMDNMSNLTAVYSSMGISDYLCFPRKNLTLLIGGQYENPEYYFLKFQVSACVNLTSAAGDSWKPTCQSDTNTDTFAANNAVRTQFLLSNYVLNPSDPENLLNQIISSDLFFQIQPKKIAFTTDIFFTDYNIQTDNSLFFTSNYVNETINVQEYGNFRPQYSLYTSGSTNPYATFFFNRGRYSQNYTRQYMKFQDLISSLGGFAQVVLTIAAIIVGFYNSQSYILELANTFYDFDFEEENNKSSKQQEEGHNSKNNPNVDSFMNGEVTPSAYQADLTDGRRLQFKMPLANDPDTSLKGTVQQQGEPKIFAEFSKKLENNKVNESSILTDSKQAEAKIENVNVEIYQQVNQLPNTKEHRNTDKIIEGTNNSEPNFETDRHLITKDQVDSLQGEENTVQSLHNATGVQDAQGQSRKKEQIIFTQKLSPIKKQDNDILAKFQITKSYGDETIQVEEEEEESEKNQAQQPISAGTIIDNLNSKSQVESNQLFQFDLSKNKQENQQIENDLQFQQTLSSRVVPAVAAISPEYTGRSFLFTGNEDTEQETIIPQVSGKYSQSSKIVKVSDEKVKLPAKTLRQSRGGSVQFSKQGSIQKQQLILEKNESQNSHTVVGDSSSSLGVQNSQFNRTIQKKPSLFKNQPYLGAIKSTEFGQIGIIKSQSQQLGFRSTNEMFSGEDNSAERHLNSSQFPQQYSFNRENYLNQQVAEVRQRKSFIQHELEMMNKKRKKIFYTFQYFLYKISFGKFYCNKQNQMIDKAQSLVVKDLDVIKILDKIQEIDRMKCLILDYQQVVLFNYFPRPLVQLSELEKSKLQKKVISLQKNQSVNLLSNDNNLLRTLFRAKQKFKMSITKKNESNIHNLINYSSYHNKQTRGTEHTSEVDYEKLYTNYKKISKKDDKSKIDNILIDFIGEELQAIFKKSEQIKLSKKESHSKKQSSMSKSSTFKSPIHKQEIDASKNVQEQQ